MFLIDTNVLSASMRPCPPAEVARWLAARPLEQVATAAICEAEILAGIAILAPGRRRAELEAAARAVFERDLAGRVWPFDRQAAIAYAELFQLRRATGRPAGRADLMIASVARSRGAIIVTRDVGGFEATGLTIINPWATP